MNAHNRGAAPFTPFVPAGRSLLFLLAGLLTFQTRAAAQSTPSRAIRPVSDRSESPRPDRIEANHPRSIQLYRRHCIECHEADGRGESSREIMRAIPDFTEPRWHMERSNERLVRSIREGRGFMPAMKDKLGATDVVELVSLVRNFREGRRVVPDTAERDEAQSTSPELEKSRALKTPAARAPQLVARAASQPVNVRAGGAPSVYQRFCVSCHGADGQGSALRSRVPWLPDFASATWHEQRTDAQLKISILEGKGKAMPPFHGRLDEAQVSDLIIYLRSFAPALSQAVPTPTSDFHRRFQQLQNEMDDLKRQYRDLSRQ
jgi:mono/diheme cytochrome c family protein